jgi:hypothetical protein
MNYAVTKSYVEDDAQFLRENQGPRDVPKGQNSAANFMNSSLHQSLLYKVSTIPHHVCRTATQTPIAARIEHVDMFVMFTLPYATTAHPQSDIHTRAKMAQHHKGYTAKPCAKPCTEDGSNACEI